MTDTRDYFDRLRRQRSDEEKILAAIEAYLNRANQNSHDLCERLADILNASEPELDTGRVVDELRRRMPDRGWN